MPQFVKGAADISVVIPAYNAQKYLQEALNSVYKQSFAGSVEIVAVNDGSIDDTLQILKDQAYPLSIISQANQGVLGSRKTGIEAAQGNYITVLDADDLYLEHKLQRQWNFLRENPEQELVFAQVEQFISPDVSKVNFMEIPEAFRVMPSLNFQGSMFCRDLLKEVSLSANLNIRNGDFLEWFTRVREANKPYTVLNEILLKRRVHDTNTGIIEKEREHLDYLKILREKLHRGRRSGDPK